MVDFQASTANWWGGTFRASSQHRLTLRRLLPLYVPGAGSPCLGGRQLENRFASCRATQGPSLPPQNILAPVLLLVWPLNSRIQWQVSPWKSLFLTTECGVTDLTPYRGKAQRQWKNLMRLRYGECFLKCYLAQSQAQEQSRDVNASFWERLNVLVSQLLAEWNHSWKKKEARG